jgi:hypothetical protein
MIYKVIYEKDDLSFTGVILDVSEFETLELDQLPEVKSNLKYKGWHRKFTTECEMVYVDTEFKYTDVYMDPKKYNNEHFIYVIAGVREFIRNKKINYFLDVE